MNCNDCKANKVCDHNKYGFENCGNFIPIDVVKVIRCRDCKHYRDGYCFSQQWWNDDFSVMVDVNDFCSYRERKEQAMRKKLFISCPMKGRTEENIRKSMEKMHEIAEIVFDQKLDVIPTYIEDKPPENSTQAIWYLGKSIQLLAEADFFIGVQWSRFDGCEIEHEVARRYGIKCTFVDMFSLMPDIREFTDEGVVPCG